MFEKLGDIVKRRFISAFRTVIHGFAEFLPFYVTMFAVIFSLLTSSFFITQGFETEVADIEKAYNYHVSIKGLNHSQMSDIKNDILTVFLNDYVYRTVYVDSHYSEESRTSSYDVYIHLLTGNKNYGIYGLFKSDTLKTNLDSFLTRYNSIIYPEDEEYSDVTVATSPLYDLEAHETEYKLSRFLILLAVSAISTFLLIGVYSVRVNNQKFLYGIYSTFGADRRRLCATSAYEILVCAAIVFLPALICSIIFCNYAFAYTSTGFSFTLFEILLPLPFIFAIVIAATYFPIKAISKQEPMSMIVAQDNSNFVSRPRKSVNMLNVSFPVKYECLTLKRFRWRTIKMLALSAVFCSMFVSGLYLADLYSANEEVKEDTNIAFTVEFKDSIPDGMIRKIVSINGVRAVHSDYIATSASMLESHILISKDNVFNFSFSKKYKFDTNYIINDGFSYIPVLDGDVIEYFDSIYRIEGDPYSVLNKNNTVAIGVSEENKNIYDFKIGDTVQIGIIVIPPPKIEDSIDADQTASEDIAADITTTTTSNKDIENYVTAGSRLDYLIENYEYEYITLTIGAIIYDYPSALYGTPLIMPTSIYKSVTEAIDELDISPPRALNVYLKDSLNGMDVDRVEFELRDLLESNKDTIIYATGTYHDSLIEANKQYYHLITILSVCILFAVPIIWFFSQILFYSRRHAEFDILTSIAASQKHIFKLHLSSSLILGAVSLLSIPLSALCIQLMHSLFTYFLPSIMNIGTEVVIGLDNELWTYVICVTLTLLCSILSSVIPYFIYRKNKKAIEKSSYFTDN